MRPLKQVLIFAAASWLNRLFADGGTVQLRRETGGYCITVFSSPAPLSVGLRGVSLLLHAARA